MQNFNIDYFFVEQPQLKNRVILEKSDSIYFTKQDIKDILKNDGVDYYKEEVIRYF